jgi:hypothetical protein
VTFKYIKMSRNMTAKKCFVKVFAISQGFKDGLDFFESVRCTSFDKSDTPEWSHKSVYDV